MTFGCQVTARRVHLDSKGLSSFKIVTTSLGYDFVFPDLTSCPLLSGKAEPAEISRFQRVFHVNCSIFPKSYSLYLAAQDLRCGFDKLEFVIFPSHRFGRDSIYPIM